MRSLIVGFLIFGAVCAASPRAAALDAQIVVENEAIAVIFADRRAILFDRHPGRGIKGIDTIRVDGRDILHRPDGAELDDAQLAVLSPNRAGGIVDWRGYLRQRSGDPAAEVLRWAPVNPRTVTTLPTAAGRFLGHAREGDTVVLKVRPDHDPTALLEWIVAPEQRTIEGVTYRGLSWRLRVTGLRMAAWIELPEAVMGSPGETYVQQMWGRFIEHRVGSTDGELMPWGWQNAHHQPFTYVAGPRGAILGYFARPVAARMTVHADGRYLPHGLQIPLGKGAVRETPARLWLATTAPRRDKWRVLDGWTDAYDVIAAAYRKQAGLRETQPTPTLWWQHPSEDDYIAYQEFGAPTADRTWLRRFRRGRFREAAALGFKAIYIEGIWDVDGNHPPSQYQPKSQSFGSIDAPWRLRINALAGGPLALRELVDAAQEQDIRILLWTTPGHLSNSSPLLQDHPGWLRWQIDGTPETAGYGDITGVDLNSGYFDYAVARYRALHKASGYHGLWIDSYLTFGMLPNAGATQLVPQFDRTVALQRAWQAMGAGAFHIEGCGMLGVSTGGYGIEAIVLGGPDDQREARELIRRIRGREYGLYRYIADVSVEADSYFRTLAAKGAVGVFDLDLIDRLSDRDRARIARANRDYMEALPEMERRELIGDGERWLGVLWHNRSNTNRILFAIASHRFVTGPATIETIGSTEKVTVKESFEAQPMRVYRIVPSP